MLKSVELYKQQRSILTQVHPFLKIYVLSLISFLLIFINNASTLIYINIFSFSLLFLIGLKFSTVCKFAGSLLLLMYSTVISQTLFYNGVPKTLWFQWDIPYIGLVRFWEEGFSYGFIASLRYVSPLILSIVMYLTTSTEQFLNAFSSLKLPFEIRFMLTTALRFIPIFIEDYKTVRTVQLLKGYRFSFKQPLYSIKKEIKFLQPVFFHALRNAHEVSEAVIGRGYHPNIQVNREALRFSVVEWVIAVIFSFIFILILSIKLLYILYINEILYFSELRFLYHLNRYYL